MISAGRTGLVAGGGVIIVVFLRAERGLRRTPPAETGARLKLDIVPSFNGPFSMLGGL